MLVITNKLPCIVLFLLIALTSTHAQGEGSGSDLKPVVYKSIEHALVRGDEKGLPTCKKGECAADMLYLLKAAAFRIRWNLVDSLSEARHCLEQPDLNHDVTRYACARLIDSDATNLYGERGHWATIGVLAKTLKKGYADRAWGRSSPISSNPTIVEENRLKRELKKHHFDPISYDYDDAIYSVPLFGDGKPKTYIYDGHNAPVIRSVINYPSANVKVNGVSLVMLIDTGSSTTALYASSAKRLGIGALDLYRGYSRGITGIGVQTKVGVAKSIEFANMTLHNAIVGIVQPGVGAAGDGVVGLDILDKMPAMMFTKTALLVNPSAPPGCDGAFTMSSNFYAKVNGIVAAGSQFNGLPAVAVLDTGNAAQAVAPTWALVKRHGLSVTDRHRSILGTFDGPRPLDSGHVSGTLDYLGVKYSGQMTIGAAYPDGSIDFNIGMPYFYGRDLYISFKDMKICMSH